MAEATCFLLAVSLTTGAFTWNSWVLGGLAVLFWIVSALWFVLYLLERE